MISASYVSTKRLVIIELGEFKCKMSPEAAERLRDMLTAALREGGFGKEKNPFGDFRDFKGFEDIFKGRK